MPLNCIIIDDSLFIRQNVKSIIEGAGHNVIAMFASGSEVLNNINQYNPDVIFCDIILPEMTGLDLLKLITEGFPKTKIIMLSGVTQGEAISAALRLGAIDFLQKPVDKDRLVLLLDKIAETALAPSLEELTTIGVGCAILSGFFEELSAHSASTLRKVINQQIQTILEELIPKSTGMLLVDVEHLRINADPKLWGLFEEKQVMKQLRSIPQDLKFELEFLYSPDYIKNLYEQAVMTMGSKKRYIQLFDQLSPETVGLPPLPIYSDPSYSLSDKSGTTYEELDKSLSIAYFIFDIAGPEVKNRINPALLTEADLMKNSIFYYALIGEDQGDFQEGLFGPLPVSSEQDHSLSSMAYTMRKPDMQGNLKTLIISIFFTPIAENIASDYNKISFIIRTRLAPTKYVEDIDKTLLRGLIDDIIDYLLKED